MNRLLLPLVLFLGFALAAAAQAPAGSGIIKGMVQDSVNAEAIVFATVGLREPGKTEAVKAGYTSATGQFEFANLAAKPYEVVISFVGYSTKVIPVNGLAKGEKIADLKTIKLAPAARQLKDVEITADKPLIKQDIDKLTYDVEADPESKTLTALDLLRKVPLITVDGQDKIELKGSTNYKVLVNGKSSGLFARDPSEVFKSMPASSIQKIEVITEPSAKYDAEGVGGIINIITVKESLGGYNGSVTARAGLPENYNLSGFGTIKTGKLGVSLYLGDNIYTRPESKSIFRRRNFLNEGTELRQDGVNSNQGEWRYLNAQLSYELDSLNLFTSEINLHGGAEEGKFMQLAQVLTGSGELVQSYYRNNLSDESWSGNGFSVDYQRSFANKPERLLTLSYNFSADNFDDLTDLYLTPVLNFNGFNGQTSNIGKTFEHTGQVDFVYPVKKHTLEAGVKSIIRLNESDFYYGIFNPVSNNLEINPALSNTFDYRQDIYAAYSSASFRKDKWGLKIGARLEETRINANFRSSETVAKQEYLNLIPSVALTRKFGEMTSLKLSYNQRIERPGLWNLNPYINQTDPRNIRYGNPALRPVISHTLDLGYNTFVKGTSVGGSIFETFTNKSVQEFTVLGSDSVSRTSYGNIGKNQVLGLSFFGNTTLFKNLSVRANVSVRYNWITSTGEGFNRSNNGITANYSGGFTYKMGKTWKLSGNGGGSSSRVTLQGRSTGYFWNSVSVSKAFLPEDKITLTFSVNSPFQRTRKWGNEINDPEFYQLNENYFVNQSFNLSLTYKFGKLKDGVAQTKRGIQNDDVNGNGNNGGGGGQ